MEKHLKLRNFLVGHQLSLADVYLTAVLLPVFEKVLDKKMRTNHLPNLTRAVTLNQSSYHFAHFYGDVHFCQKQAAPEKVYEKP